MTTLADDAIMIPILVIVMGSVIWIMTIIVNGIRDTRTSRDREESRREIAAYIAEGSMTFEQGERLMKAGEKAPDNKPVT
ncbi:MAG: hypothetical protein JSS51_02805 [Planctomycetes bacterium]|nr:hypothetical protein [Planctomycetota bacterium]